MSKELLALPRGEWLTLGDAARSRRCSKEKLKNLIRRGKWKPETMFDGRWVCGPDDLTRLDAALAALRKYPKRKSGKQT